MEWEKEKMDHIQLLIFADVIVEKILHSQHKMFQQKQGWAVGAQGIIGKRISMKLKMIMWLGMMQKERNFVWI